jgi:glutathione synthase
MKFLVISNPIEGLNPNSDTGLAFAEESFFRGHETSWVTPDQIEYESDFSEKTSGSLNLYTQKLSFSKRRTLPETEKEKLSQISEFDGIWIRKDPPFDMKYVSLCWWLMLEEKSTNFLNPPSSLIQHHEKIIPFQALSEGVIEAHEVIPSLAPASKNSNLPKGFKTDKGLITKPWLGHGGRNVKKWTSLDEAKTNMPDHEFSDSLVQPYFDEVKSTGDQRVFVLNGKVLGSFSRIPKDGNFISNLSQGGSAVSQELTEAERNTCEKMAAWLKSQRIYFAGLDIMAGRLSEVNITAPTGVRHLEDLTGFSVAEKYVEFAESL